MKKSTTEEFIIKAKHVHRNKYDYSKTNYVNNSTKVNIICPEHGEFIQTPSDHLSYKGCQICGIIKCSNSRLNTLQEFIQKALQIHNSKYDYSESIYKGSNNKIIIICPKHGEFEQTPHNHLQGQGCYKCKSEKIGNLFRSNTKEFIEKARTIHNDKYDYSRVNYINIDTKVTIICPEHSVFEQTPDIHLRSGGCSKCSGKHNHNTNEWIYLSQQIHGDRYNYSKSNYINSQTKIIITCSKHGDFNQIPGNHLNGSGCPRCKKSKGEIAIMNILENHNIVYEDEYRIPEVADELYYDFYLPEYNLLIEFHGKQHYEYIPFFHDNDNRWDFDAQKTRDDIVRYNARKWKYRYIEFNYKQLKHMPKEEFKQLVINKIK